MNHTPPTAIELRADGLHLEWADGAAHLQAAALRSACRCGGCRAHPVVPALLETVQLEGAAPVGQYALQLLFSDGHDRGIYPWLLLRELSFATSP